MTTIENINLPSGGGSSLFKGWFADDTALNAAYPVGSNGWYAIVGSTDSVWIWDSDTAAWVDSGETALGDVVGPGSATDNAIARFDGTTGKIIQNSLATVDDSGSVNIPTGQAYKINNVDIVKDLNMSGVIEWGGAGVYWSVNGPPVSRFTVERAGTGRIKNKVVSWAGGQFVNAVSNATCIVYVDNTGTLQCVDVSTLYNSNKLTEFNNFLNLYTENIVLFEIWTDATNHLVVKDTHLYRFNTAISVDAHSRFGSVYLGSGAKIQLLDAGARTIKLVGEDLLDDHGLYTRIPDSGGAAINLRNFYKNGSNIAVEYTTIPNVVPSLWVNSGTVTALNNDANHRYGLVLIMAVKDNLNADTPTYLGILANTAWASPTAVYSALEGNGSLDLSMFTVPNEIMGLEPAILGLVLVDGSDTSIEDTADLNGFTDGVQSAKQTNSSQYIAGAVSVANANNVLTDTTNFNNVLTTSETNVQLALDRLNTYALPKENFVNKNADFNVDGVNNTVYNVTTGASTITATITATPYEGLQYWFRKADSGSGKLTTSPAVSNELFSQDDIMCIRYNGSAWKVVNHDIMPIVDIFETSGTWNKKAGATRLKIELISGGGGGGSGRRGAAATSRGSGGGGQGGGYNIFTPLASQVGASESITIGAGGSGGAARTADDTSGAVGADGGDTLFGSLFRVKGGDGGALGSTGQGVTAYINNGLDAGGIGGGGYYGTTPDTGGVGNFSGGGGGGGGGVNNSDVERAGGTGGASGGAFTTTDVAGGTAGVTDSARDGGNGSNVTLSEQRFHGGSGGGGGAGESDGVNAAGSGGTGGTPGGGGAGGGASLNGANSGAGGAGANGAAKVVTYFD